MEMRLQKYLAWCGVASRRKAEELIAGGHVTVNGECITQMGFCVNTDVDIVYCGGQKVGKYEDMIYIMLHKPTGYVTTTDDQFNRKTVLDLITDVKERIYPVGRLDYDTSGLLLLTNDGSLAYKLTHPSHNVEKKYIARISGVPNERELTRFRNGLMIDGVKTATAKVKMLKHGKGESVVEIVIHEGRNRQVRKMCEAIGYPVVELKRIAIGSLELGDLPIGSWRVLSHGDIYRR